MTPATTAITSMPTTSMIMGNGILGFIIGSMPKSCSLFMSGILERRACGCDGREVLSAGSSKLGWKVGSEVRVFFKGGGGGVRLWTW